MIGMVWVMLRARAGLAMITFGLTAVAVAAATVGPLYADAAARSVLAVEVADAPAAEKIITADRLSQLGFDGGGGDTEPTQPYREGFRTLTGALVNGELETEYGTADLWLAARTGICEQLVLRQGRCAVADREVVVRQDTAQTMGAHVGTEVLYGAFAFGGGAPIGSMRLTVVGVYEPYLPTDPYWADRFMLAGGSGGPIFTTERTVRLAAGPILSTTDLIASPEAFADPSRLASDVEELLELFGIAEYNSDTEIFELIARIDQADRVLFASLAVATLPLVLICWFVLFLAVVGAVERRRGELAVTALRGVPPWQRWGLPGAETLAPVLAGAVPGFLLGIGVTALLARTLPWPTPVTTTGLSLLLGCAAVLGALLAGALAQANALREPVVALLRGVQRPRSTAAVRTTEAIVAALALAAGYQAATSSGGGISLLAPLCFSLGVGLLAGRLVRRPAERLGRWVLRRGHLALGLAALSVTRRPGSRAIVALLTVGFGMLGFAIAAVDTGQRAWDQRSYVETGAYRVLPVLPISATQLVESVRKIDPQGRFAMATARIEVPGVPPALAVDSTRLAAVVNWPGEPDGLTAEQVSRLLRPAEPKSLAIQAAAIAVDVTLNEIEVRASARLTLNLVSAGGDRITLITSELQQGAGAYRLDTPACEQQQCRITGLAISLASYGHQRIDVTVGEIRDELGEVLVEAQALADLDGWVQAEESAARPVAALSSTEEGLNFVADSPIAVDLRLRADMVPDPMPVVATGQVPERFAAVGGGAVPVTLAAGVPMLPRFGANGVLIDIEYADLAISRGAEAQSPEVWLTADAPDNIVERLRQAGVIVFDDISSAGRNRLFTEQAPALALRFLLLAAAAVLILSAAGLLVPAVLDRRRPDADLSVLRPHGVPERTIRVGAVLGRCALVLVAAVAGLGSATLAWVAARQVVPVYTGNASSVPVPSWPDPVIGVSLLAALAFLLVSCWLAARVARSRVEGIVR